MLRYRLRCTFVHQDDGNGNGDGDSDSNRDGSEASSGGGADVWRPEQTYSVLNEVVVDRGESSSLTLLNVYCDDQLVTRVQA